MVQLINTALTESFDFAVSRNSGICWYWARLADTRYDGLITIYAKASVRATLFQSQGRRTLPFKTSRCYQVRYMVHNDSPCATTSMPPVYRCLCQCRGKLGLYLGLATGFIFRWVPCALPVPIRDLSYVMLLVYIVCVEAAHCLNHTALESK